MIYHKDFIYTEPKYFFKLKDVLKTAAGVGGILLAPATGGASLTLTAGALASELAKEKIEKEKQVQEELIRQQEEAQKRIIETQKSIIEERKTEMSEQFIPDRQETAIQDLTELIRNLNKSVLSTYQDIQSLKLQAQLQKVIPETEEISKRNLTMALVLGSLLFIGIILARRK